MNTGNFTIEEKKLLARRAFEKAKEVLKKGDKIRVLPARCFSKKVNIIFSHWDGVWMVSVTGQNEYHPMNIDKVNGVSVNFLEQNS